MALIACMDVGYRDDSARSACVTLDDWAEDRSLGEYVIDIDHIEPYVPGQFFRRELPCVMAVLDELPAAPDVIVIDGYVWLDGDGRKGLGAYLYQELHESTPIIGVAKTRFATATTAVEVLRGGSDRPLMVTSAGTDQDFAADCIRRMHGSNRIPTLLKRVDRLSRTEGS